MGKKYILDLFSGIGGFALAAYRANLRFDAHYFSEIKPSSIDNYKLRFPDAIHLGDIKDIDYETLPKGKWLVSGGFPCQPHSVAGKKKGANDERDLWPECRRMLRNLRPEITLFENVLGLLVSDEGIFFNNILTDISESGYAAEWQIISAAEFGADHLRRRLWLVAYANSKRWYNLDKKQKNGHAEKYLKIFEYKTKWEKREYEKVNPLLSMDRSFSNPSCGIVRNDDGLSEGMDRLENVGNAIFPQCAEMIFNLPAFDYFRGAVK